MTSTIKVNNIQNQCGANIINESSNTITIGASGDTISLASGASQSGFGRTGTVDWQTTPKTANFTAVNGEGYFVNTTSGAVTMTMPSGSAGAIVSIQDYNKTFDTNNFTITPASGEKINGGDASASLVIITEGQGLTFVYVDSTVGWKTIHENEFTAGGSDYISATGGTITCCGDFKIHTFTGPGTFTVSSTGAPANNTLEYIVVAGGGGNGFCGGNAMGGAGAGGFRLAAPSLAPLTYPGKPLSTTGLTATAAAFPITVGAGGSPGPGINQQGTAGSTSTFSTISSAGGAKGSRGAANCGVGCAGGSGAGGAGGGYNRAAGAGNTPPVSPPQGQPGGNSGNNPAYPDHASGGGGGAICAGAQGRSISNNASGKGGDGAGVPTAFGANGEPCGSFRYYAGGGAGEYYAPVTSEKAPGGKGGGGNGGTCTPGTANTGGGGGGGGTPGDAGGAGGSGIVIIRYKYQN